MRPNSNTNNKSMTRRRTKSATWARKSSVLLLSLCSCAPMWGGSSGRFASREAICTVTSPVFAQYIATVPSYRYNSYGYAVPNRVAVGIEECYLAPNSRVKITGMGQYMGTKQVESLEKGCIGDVPVEAIDRCEGGLSATEIAFPFTRPLPVLKRE